MKEIRSKIIAVASVALFAVSVSACDSVSPDGGSTGTVVITDAADSSAEDTEETDAADGAVSEAPVPERDDDGSKISVIEVTDKAGEVVTDADSKPVTEIALIDDKGTVITDSKGHYAKPNLKPVTEAQHIVDNKVTIGKPPKMEENNPNAAEILPYGPTVTIDSTEAAAGDTVSLKVKISGNGNSGFMALLGNIDIDTKYFDIVETVGGDKDDEENEFSVPYNNMTFNVLDKSGTVKTVNTLFLNPGANVSGDFVLATITLKVKDDAPAGKYDIAFDLSDPSAKCNMRDDSGSEPVVKVLTAKFVNGSVTVK